MVVMGRYEIPVRCSCSTSWQGLGSLEFGRRRVGSARVSFFFETLHLILACVCVCVCVFFFFFFSCYAYDDIFQTCCFLLGSRISKGAGNRRCSLSVTKSHEAIPPPRIPPQTDPNQAEPYKDSVPPCTHVHGPYVARVTRGLTESEEKKTAHARTRTNPDFTATTVRYDGALLAIGARAGVRSFFCDFCVLLIQSRFSLPPVPRTPSFCRAE